VETVVQSLRHSGVSLYTSTCVFAQTCVFSKQSLDPFHCDPRKLLHPQRHSLSRSYGVMLQSSFTSILSSALEYSSRLPVSDCGTNVRFASDGFSWLIFQGLRQHNRPGPCGSPRLAGGTLSNQRHIRRIYAAGAGILTRFSIVYAFRP